MIIFVFEKLLQQLVNNSNIKQKQKQYNIINLYNLIYPNSPNNINLSKHFCMHALHTHKVTNNRLNIRHQTSLSFSLSLTHSLIFIINSKTSTTLSINYFVLYILYIYHSSLSLSLSRIPQRHISNLLL